MKLALLSVCLILEIVGATLAPSVASTIPTTQTSLALRTSSGRRRALLPLPLLPLPKQNKAGVAKAAPSAAAAAQPSIVTVFTTVTDEAPSPTQAAQAASEPITQREGSVDGAQPASNIAFSTPRKSSAEDAQPASNPATSAQAKAPSPKPPAAASLTISAQAEAPSPSAAKSILIVAEGRSIIKGIAEPQATPAQAKSVSTAKYGNATSVELSKALATILLAADLSEISSVLSTAPIAEASSTSLSTARIVKTESTSPAASQAAGAAPNSATSPQLPPGPIQQYGTIPPQGSGGICGGSPNGCWGNLSIETDSEVTWPNTGRVVEYNFTLVNTTCSFDGNPKPCLVINNQFPGPMIEANWGDVVRVTVNNQLQDNGTSFHWHGIRQMNSNAQDGVSGLTECPTPPGSSKTYEWQATNYGTSWYHSHSAAQYGDGILGPIVIHGHCSAGYDIDMGPITISEAYTQGATEFDNIITKQGPLTDVPTNILFNGMNVNANGSGTRLTVKVQPGMRHLMRFINTGVDNYYKVGIDGHMMQVVAIDLQPVQPYMAQYVALGVGQRFDAIVAANGTVGNYYLRAIPGACVMNMNDGKGSQNAIVSYAGAGSGLPTSQAAPVGDDCKDEPLEKTIPFVAKAVDASNFDPYHLPIASPYQVTSNEEGRVLRWQIGKTTQVFNWENPILERLVQGNTTITPEDNIIGVDEQNTWAYWYIQNNFLEPHPIHMHGNDLRILATGDGQWDANVTNLNTVNPMRRDTFMMPPGGYTILAFYTDNPGVWLLHCHIAWHASEGLSTALYVRKDDIKLDVAQRKAIEEGCAAWDSYISNPNKTLAYSRIGSGI